MTSARLAITVASLALVGALVPPIASAGWREPIDVASPINHANNQGAGEPSLRAVAGVPFVAWHESDGTNTELRVSRLNTAGTAWEEVVGGTSPINHAANRTASTASVAAVGGVPYVAWVEFDGTNYELRVSRLNAAGTAWQEVVGGDSPINHAGDRDARQPSLAAVGGVPYVAWIEFDGTNYEVRVSRVNPAGTAWEEVVGGDSPINHAANRYAFSPSVAAVGGVPYVAWIEHDGTNYEVRASRLNAAGTAWQQVVGGDSPINHAADRDAFTPSLVAIGGAPSVAWTEEDGTNAEVRVARLNAAGTAWEQIVGGPSPINHAAGQNAGEASLTTIGGVPYVAWNEDDGTNYELRVSRLDATGTTWQELVGGASPINHAADEGVGVPDLTAVGGVPYVAWHEFDGSNTEVRVSRLEPEFTSQSAVASATGATLRAGVHTYGIRYPVGFQYGPALARETTALPAPAGSDHVTITSRIGGLRPATGHAFRPFAAAGVPAPRVLGAIDAFTTGATTRLAFGARTGVTLRLAGGRIRAGGPIPVRVLNTNGFRVTGKLWGRTTLEGSRTRRVKLKAESFRVGAHARTTVKLRLPKVLRQRRYRKLSLRLTARVNDPAGHTRTVTKRVKLKPKRMVSH
jgi:hypothetical protein